MWDSTYAACALRYAIRSKAFPACNRPASGFIAVPAALEGCPRPAVDLPVALKFTPYTFPPRLCKIKVDFLISCLYFRIIFLISISRKKKTGFPEQEKAGAQEVVLKAGNRLCAIQQQASVMRANEAHGEQSFRQDRFPGGLNDERLYLPGLTDVTEKAEHCPAACPYKFQGITQ